MKKKIVLFLIIIVLLIMSIPLIKSVIELEMQDAKYKAIHEITSGDEVTIIVDEYINATIVSEEWNEDVLECIEKNTAHTGMFAGQSKKEYYVFRGIKPGKTEIEFIVNEFGHSVRKTYEAEVSDSLFITVCPTGKEQLEDFITEKHPIMP
ncbi:MAG: hypothetical protein MJ123_06740 [Lachnospiraceae bacterium]|nr:hypothetical protein [Lachnospiraceae bacterium]